MPQKAEAVMPGKGEKHADPRVRFVDTQASVFLDLLRGLAALLVLGEHWRNLFFVDYRQLPQHGRIFLLPYLFTAAGHQAVIIFFVLSGYLIGGSVFRSLRTNGWSWRLYLTHRLVRLWLVLLPGLLLGLLWDKVGLSSGRAPLLYGGINLNHMTMHPIASVLSLKIFWGNLFFVQGWLVPLFGSDNALWSLPFEFWYYVLFPLGVLVVAGRSRVAERIGYVALLAALVTVMHRPILVYMPIWLLGAAMVSVPIRVINARLRWLVSGLYVPLVLWFGVANRCRRSSPITC